MNATTTRRRFYSKLSGMTGTARSAAAEFYEIYGLRVVPIPTNKPPRRKDLPLRLYYTEKVCWGLLGLREWRLHPSSDVDDVEYLGRWFNTPCPLTLPSPSKTTSLCCTPTQP